MEMIALGGFCFILLLALAQSRFRNYHLGVENRVHSRYTHHHYRTQPIHAPIYQPPRQEVQQMPPRKKKESPFTPWLFALFFLGILYFFMMNNNISADKQNSQKSRVEHHID